MGIENRVQQNLDREIQIDNRITQGEQSVIKENLRTNKDTVVQIAKNQQGELSDFLKREYYFLSKREVDIAGIKTFQQRMGLRGDGIYGPNTFEKVVAFQESQGLPKDGIITRSLLALATGERETNSQQQTTVENTNTALQVIANKTEQLLSRNQIKELQEYFSQRKTGGVDAAFIEKVREFQHIRRLNADGIAGPNTYREFQVAKGESTHTPMTQTEVNRANRSLDRGRNLPGIESLSERWQIIYQEFFLKLNSGEQREVLSGRTPITLADSRTQKAIYITGGRFQKEFSVIFGYNGFANGSLNTKGATPRKVVSRFNGANIARSEYGCAANNPAASPTVLGAAILSPEGAAGGGKWFHGVSDARMQRMRNGTAGCVGMSVQNARTIARDVVNTGRGFGYVS